MPHCLLGLLGPGREACPSDEGCTIRVAFLDPSGEAHTAVVHSTQRRTEVLADGARIKAAIEAYYASLGYVLLSVQLMVESAQVVREAPPPRTPGVRGHLRLAASSGKNLLSDA